VSAADDEGKQLGGERKAGSANLDAESADGRVDSETSSPMGSQASESSMMSLTSSKASFINNTQATTSTAESSPVCPPLFAAKALLMATTRCPDLPYSLRTEYMHMPILEYLCELILPCSSSLLCEQLCGLSNHVGGLSGYQFTLCPQ
jgi:hypothetical protein